MTYTSLEIISLVLIVISVIKILVLLISPKAWFHFAKKVWKNDNLVRVVCLILAITVLYYLISEGTTITQILAVTSFVALIIAVGIGQRVNDLIKHYEKLAKNRSIIKDHWLYILIWLVLIIWGLKEIFV